MADRLNWGILSTARINRSVVPPIQKSKRSKLLAVGSRNPQAAEEFAKKYKVPRTHASYEALLADPEIDVIYNPLPNSLHAEWTIKALRAGKHVLCEKPLALTVEEVDAVIAAAKETGKVVTEAFMYRHHPQTIQVKELIDGGAVGDVLLIRGAYCYKQSRPNDVRLEPELGGGSIWDVGCYPISFARYIVGVEPVRFMGWMIPSDKGIDLSFAGQMIFPGEVCAQVHSSFQSPYEPFMEITGSEGRMRVPVPFKPGDRTSVLVEKEGRVDMLQFRSKELYAGEIADMEDAVLLGNPPRISLEDSRGNVAAILSLIEAARMKQIIS